MRIGILLLLLFCLNLDSFSKWDPNAGLVESYTKNALISVSSGAERNNIIDANLDSFWESGSQLPDAYISNSSLNIFLKKDKYIIDDNNPNAGFAFDGLDASNVKIRSGKIEIIFKKPEPVKKLSLKLNTANDVSIEIKSDNGNINDLYGPDQNYSFHLIDIPDTSLIKSVTLSCNQSFEVFEIAGLVGTPVEHVLFDLKETKTIGWVGSKNYNGDGILKIDVLASSNKIDWSKICELNPNSTTFVDNLLTPQVTARYVKVIFYMPDTDYQKAKLHEFELYDKYGPYGLPPSPQISAKTFKNSFGINAIWGWGYGVPSSKLGMQKGPYLFNKVAKLARNYHGIDWDIAFPGQDPNYEKMKLGKGTSANKWVNWFNEYSTWKAAGFKIDACLMFNNNYFPDTLWSETLNESDSYGDHFSDFFIDKHELVSVVEIGNEPWEYSKSTYREILSGMSFGIFTNAENAKILPCAVQAYDKKDSNGNYISQYINQYNSNYISGLNTHVYSYVNTGNGYKVAINPEDRRSEVWSVNNIKRFSQVNMKSIPVYVTEFGYDSDGGGDNCTHSVCVNEVNQAIYGIRMALILFRLGVEEFYWYYYANVDGDSFFHNRSGLVSSYSSGFQKKKSFLAFETLQNHIGDMHFIDVINETEEYYAYVFGDKDGNESVLVAWLPGLNNSSVNAWIDIPLPKRVNATVTVITKDDYVSPGFVNTVDGVRINLSGIPVILILE